MGRKYKGVLAVDFDNTLARSEYPKILGMISSSKRYLNRLYNDEWYIIINTCRVGIYLEEAKDWLDSRGYKYHLINEQNADLVKAYGETRKISADFYIDDKNIFGLPAWSKTYQHLSNLPKSFKSILNS